MTLGFFKMMIINYLGVLKKFWSKKLILRKTKHYIYLELVGLIFVLWVMCLRKFEIIALEKFLN